MSAVLTTLRDHSHDWSVLRRRRVTNRSTNPAGFSLPTLARRERVLAREDFSDRGLVIGTDRAMYLRDGASAWRRIAWIDVATAAWSGRTDGTVLRLWAVDGDTGTELQVPTGAAFAVFAAERVSSTQVMCRRVQLGAGSCATVTALRQPGQHAVVWRVRLDPGCDGDDAALAAAGSAALRELRALAGC
jgi:hypothetical protein